MQTRWRIWLLVGAVALAASATTGCSRGSGEGSSTEPKGTLSVALTGTTPGGTSYHLTNAVFEITNYYAGLDLVVPGDDATLQVDLPPSVSPYGFDYVITLQRGWALNAVNSDGTETPLGATLLGNSIPFTIKPQRTTPITFPFKATEQVATTGNGAAAVHVTVDDSLIDDFEDGTGQIAPLGGRKGSWFTYNDGTGIETPAPGTPVLPVVIDTSANYLLRTAGSGFAFLGPLPDGTFAYGAGVGTILLAGPTGALPYDASSYAGIQFDISLQSNFSFSSYPQQPPQLSFFVETSATTPPELGGTCTSGCFDYFGIVGPYYTSSYPSTYTFRFTWGQLAQQGFGTPAVFDPSTIIAIAWQVAFPPPAFGPVPSAADNTFEMRLDNIAFIPGFSAAATGGNLEGGVVTVDAGVTPEEAGAPDAGDPRSSETGVATTFAAPTGVWTPR